MGSYSNLQTNELTKIKPNRLRQELKRLHYAGPKLTDKQELIAKIEELRQAPPTPNQIKCLQNLRYTGELPATRPEATKLIAKLQEGNRIDNMLSLLTGK